MQLSITCLRKKKKIDTNILQLKILWIAKIEIEIQFLYIDPDKDDNDLAVHDVCHNHLLVHFRREVKVFSELQ